MPARKLLKSPSTEASSTQGGVLVHGKKLAKSAIQVPSDQLDLPVTYDAGGQLISLRDALAARASIRSLATLSPEKRAELTAKRIEAQPHFELAMVGAGIVDKQRAIEEVRAQSGVGRVLIEIEQRVVNSLIEAIAEGGLPRPGAARAAKRKRSAG